MEDESPPESPLDDGRQCNVCFGPATRRSELVNVCLCKGTLKWVHRECLNKWRRHATDASQCPTCRFPYRIRRVRASQWLKGFGFEALRVGLSVAVEGLVDKVGLRVEEFLREAGNRYALPLTLRVSGGPRWAEGTEEVLLLLRLGPLVVRALMVAHVWRAFFDFAPDAIPLVSQPGSDWQCVEDFLRAHILVEGLRQGLGEMGSSLAVDVEFASSVVNCTAVFAALAASAAESWQRVCRDATSDAEVLPIDAPGESVEVRGALVDRLRDAVRKAGDVILRYAPSSVLRAVLRAGQRQPA